MITRIHSRLAAPALLIIVAVLQPALRLPAQSPTTDLSEDRLQRQFHQDVRPFLTSYCLDCHGSDDPEAKLNLTGFGSVRDVTQAYQVWETVMARVEAKEMPPEEAGNLPSEEERQALTRWFGEVREAEIARTAGDPGPIFARRLSNAEFNYTIRDLTGVDIRPTDTFPVDPANEAGFDNSGESLAMSPALLNKYLGAARQVVEHLLLTPEGIAFAPHSVVTNTDRDKYCVKRIVEFYHRQPTDYADYFYAAWSYQYRSKLKRADDTLAEFATSEGISSKYLETIWSLLNDKSIATGPIEQIQRMWNELPPDPIQRTAAREGCRKISDFIIELRSRLTFSFPNLQIEGSNRGSQPFVLWKNRQYVQHRRKLNREAFIAPPSLSSNGQAPSEPPTTRATIDSLLVLPQDDVQRARVMAAFESFCSVFPDAFYISERGRDYVDEGQKQEGEKGRLLSAGFHSMMGYFRDDRPLYDLILDQSSQQEIDRLWRELDFITSAPMRQYSGFLWFERTDSRFMRDEAFDFARAEDKSASSQDMIERLAEVYLDKARANGGGETEVEAIEHYFREINEQIRWVERARVDAEPTHVRSLLDFAQRAYRRPTTPTERQELVAFYQSLRAQDGLSHEEAIQDAMVSILLSPHFCYRLDLATIGEGAAPLSQHELASRLSYFLWSSLPDEELLALASSGELHRPEILIAQTRRMLLDDRAKGLAAEFGGNWLDFRRFQEHNSVDRERFPQFDDGLRQAMFEEPLRLLMDVIQRDRSVLDLLFGQDTFVNAALAEHYRMPTIPNNHRVQDDGWRHIENAAEYGRGGLLPMAVFLTKNSPGLRTSPVKRGYWVVRNLLGEEIPPPPPNVPELPNDESRLGDLTLREALALHREHASCAGCHQRIDSIGLVFEGFGPIGERRRTDLGGRPVDTKASFPGGADGEGLAGLQTYLQNHRQSEFIDNLCSKLLSFALGRTLLLSDERLLEEMRTKLVSDEYRFGRLVECIVTSPQFLNKRGNH